MSTTRTLLRSGDVLGGFRIEDVIGVGGMAIVYRAEQICFERPVALKVLSSRLSDDGVFRERFRREGAHAAALEHPNIVPVYDSGEAEGVLYLAMQLVEGTNLAELVQIHGVTADRTIEILRPVASALDRAHAAGLVHRDVKPQNILISHEGYPYLADFGVAKGSNTYGLTATGGFVGSVNYASPEQIRGLTLTAASDIYALTAVLYHCLTGRVPYPCETDAGVIHAHLNDPPPTLPSLDGADSDFHTVLARGMAKDPGSRYGHAGDLLTAAALCVGRMPSDVRRSVPAFPLERHPPSPEPTGEAAPSLDQARDDDRATATEGEAEAAPSQEVEPPVVSPPDAPDSSGDVQPVPRDRTELLPAADLAAVRQAPGPTTADRRIAIPEAPAPESPRKHPRRPHFRLPARARGGSRSRPRLLSLGLGGRAGSQIETAQARSRWRSCISWLRTAHVPGRAHTAALTKGGTSTAGADPPRPAERWPRRPWLVIGALALAVVVAVVVELSLGARGAAKRSKAAKPYPAATLVAQQRAIAAVNVASILQSILATEARELARMSAARTPGAQSAAARAIERAYAQGADRIGSLHSPEGVARTSLNLKTQLVLVARAYGGLADAASRDGRDVYARARTVVAKNEGGLQAEVNTLRSFLSSSQRSQPRRYAASGFTTSRIPNLVASRQRPQHHSTKRPAAPESSAATTTSSGPTTAREYPPVVQKSTPPAPHPSHEHEQFEPGGAGGKVP
jgi:serine/threonine protein kinase